ncbi:hypothetical protein JTB14_029652 [Gonioctena quinquepunctata]|nr:hypothetical protein JTB14_029652 [Gonioctena quinquepunctata]
MEMKNLREQQVHRGVLNYTAGLGGQRENGIVEGNDEGLDTDLPNEVMDVRTRAVNIKTAQYGLLQKVCIHTVLGRYDYVEIHMTTNELKCVACTYPMDLIRYVDQCMQCSLTVAHDEVKKSSV